MFERQGVQQPLLFIFPNTGRHSNAIHSFFCPPFDAAFISPRMRVVHYIPNILPSNPLITPLKDCSMLVEAPP